MMYSPKGKREKELGETPPKRSQDRGPRSAQLIL